MMLKLIGRGMVAQKAFVGSIASYCSRSDQIDFPDRLPPSHVPPYQPRPNEPIETIRARLLYQSRKRGMLENGLLLSTFAGKFLNAMTEIELKDYDRLINLPSNDWDIYYWATGVKPVPTEFDTPMMQKFISHVKNSDRESRLQQPNLFPKPIPESESQSTMLTFSPEEIKEIAGGDPELEKKIQFILMEHELMRQEGTRVPSNIKRKYWQELLNLRSKGQRLKFYSYLWKTEMKEKASERKKEELREKRREEYDKLPPRLSLEEDPHWMEYGLNRNTIFLRLYDTKVATFQSHRIISEMILGTPLVIDCGYDDQMVFREAKNCAAQLEFLLTDNRVHPQPYNLVFCNASPNSNLMTQLVKRIPTLYDDSYALNVSEKSYLDLFPRDKLVYLSPHAKEEVTEFNDDEIYIIGAIVDKSDPRPFSLAKAKKEGVRLKKLPLDSRLNWGIGNKSLTINQLVNIMLEIRATRDWDKAFRFIPRRKLIGGRTDFQAKPSQVLKDYDLISQRRRGFQKPRDDEYDRLPRKAGFGSRGGGSIERDREVKTIMSDY